jgi:hypothetical protein
LNYSSSIRGFICGPRADFLENGRSLMNADGGAHQFRMISNYDLDRIQSLRNDAAFFRLRGMVGQA